MKTTSHLRIFVVVVTMTAFACTEPDVVPTQTQKTTTGNNNYVPPSEYHSTVTTWQKVQEGYYNGIITQTPVTDLSKATLYWVRNGERVLIDTDQDVSKLEMYQASFDGYMWASVRGNILLINFVAKTPNSRPPFPLDVIIVY